MGNVGLHEPDHIHTRQYHGVHAVTSSTLQLFSKTCSSLYDLPVLGIDPLMFVLLQLLVVSRFDEAVACVAIICVFSLPCT